MKNKINEKQDYKAVVALAVSSAQPPFFTFRLVGGGLLLLECGGKRSATPLSFRPKSELLLRAPTAPSPLRSAGALHDVSERKPVCRPA